MDIFHAIILFFSLMIGCADAYCNCSDDPDYCDCYEVYLTWWFWVIVVVVALLKFMCIGCYVRNRRNRMQMYYVPAPAVQTSVVTRTTISAPRPPQQQQQMPPPYPGNAPPYYPPVAPPQATVDSRIEKDTQLLVG